VKVLITGGPVHAHIDAVKIITNKFKGGLMADLADRFCLEDCKVTYLSSPEAKAPFHPHRMTLIKHCGIHDYIDKVKELAPKMDAVILGAAVANLIPLNAIRGKFPSHNYKVGDVIPIDFTIAPRVIDEVKKVAPKTHLFGFKLLSEVTHEELISAAYGVLLESKATAVFANDAKDLLTKYAVTKERGEHVMSNREIVDFVITCVKDQYYKTEVWGRTTDYLSEQSTFHKLAETYKEEFKATPEGYVFGTIAVRYETESLAFLTTGRGKRELEDLVPVYAVKHDLREVCTGGAKATLNAPLLHWLFKKNKSVKAIVHFHRQLPELPTLPYAIAGTVRDSQRDILSSFNIQDHGCFLLLDKNGNRI
jgi:hypothetical protein